MKWLILSDLIDGWKVVAGYLIAIIIFNLFISNIFSLLFLALLVIKGNYQICFQNDYDHSSTMYSFFPKKRIFYVLEKHLLSAFFLIGGLVIWFITTGFYCLWKNGSFFDLLGAETSMYLFIFAILAVLINELYLIFIFKYGALDANSIARPFLLLFVLFIIVVQIINKSIDVIEIFRYYPLQLGVSGIVLIIFIFFIGFYFSCKAYNDRDF
ncbi:MAG: ABC-2 transporter permease [Eubacteriaceae bacterium]